MHKFFANSVKKMLRLSNQCSCKSLSVEEVKYQDGSVQISASPSPEYWSLSNRNVTRYLSTNSYAREAYLDDALIDSDATLLSNNVTHDNGIVLIGEDGYYQIHAQATFRPSGDSAYLGKLVIHYTTDGTEPTNGSPVLILGVTHNGYGGETLTRLHVTVSHLVELTANTRLRLFLECVINSANALDTVELEPYSSCFNGTRYAT